MYAWPGSRGPGSGGRAARRDGGDCGRRARRRVAQAAPPPEEPERRRPLFSLSYEQNVPTWYTSSLLFVCSLARCHRRRRPPHGQVREALVGALRGVPLHLALDEVVEIHEAASSWLDRLGGVLYFSWVIPAAAAVAMFLRGRIPPVPLAPPARYAGIDSSSRRDPMSPAPSSWSCRSGTGPSGPGSDNLIYALIDFDGGVDGDARRGNLFPAVASSITSPCRDGRIGFSPAAPEPRPAAAPRPT